MECALRRVLRLDEQSVRYAGPRRRGGPLKERVVGTRILRMITAAMLVVGTASHIGTSTGEGRFFMTDSDKNLVHTLTRY
jgi:hypothetical protein